MPRTIHFVSLGCPKNRVDTEVMLGVSDQAGYQLVGDPAEAQVIVVNTCGFIEAAKQESIDTILALSDLKQSGRCEKLVVSGCLSQRYPQVLATELPEVDHFLGSSDMLKLRPILKVADAPEGQHTRVGRILVGDPADYVFRLSDPRRLSLSPASAYVKIAEGCSRACSFCAIPSFRGVQRSRPIGDVVGEVERLVATGTVEINLISQDTVSYGRDLPTTAEDSPSSAPPSSGKGGRRQLVPLLQRLQTVAGLRWLRLFYLYPEKLDPALLDLLASGGPLVPYVDMPFQHASDAMLTRMRRGYRAERQREIVETLRARVPHVFIRTAFIVGHPGETDADFEALREFVGQGAFDHVGVFRYSHEDGTHSGGMQDLVPDDVVEARAEALLETQRAVSIRRLRNMVGRELEVLVEGQSEESEFLLSGRHRGQAPEIDGKVVLTNGTAKPGQLRHALVTDAGDYDLVADLSRGHDSPEGPAKKRLNVLP